MPDPPPPMKTQLRTSKTWRKHWPWSEPTGPIRKNPDHWTFQI